jgi:hypothetical protein
LATSKPTGGSPASDASAAPVDPALAVTLAVALALALAPVPSPPVVASVPGDPVTPVSPADAEPLAIGSAVELPHAAANHIEPYQQT